MSGIYRSTRTHEPLTIGGGGRGAAVRSLRGGGWLVGNSPAAFDMAPDGTPRTLTVVGADADTVTYLFAARAPWTPTAEQLAAFAGRYRSDEVPAVWIVKLDGGRLVATSRSAVNVPLTPIYPDAFTSGAGLGTIWFVRDARGAVAEMHSGSARVWDFTFKRER